VARAQLLGRVRADLVRVHRVGDGADPAAQHRDPTAHPEDRAPAADLADELDGDLPGDDLVERGVMHRRRGQQHRPARDLLAFDQRPDAVLAQHADQHRVAYARVAEVVAAQVRDTCNEMALQEGQAGDVGGDRDRERHQAADVGDEALHPRHPGVRGDQRLDRRLDVAVGLDQLGVRSAYGATEGADSVDGPLEDVAHVLGGPLRRHASGHRGEPACGHASYTHRDSLQRPA
jgi:hypothetical protein